MQPVIIRDPKLFLQPLDEAGAPDGAEVDVSCDVVTAEIGVEVPITTVSTFCGKYQVPDDPEESCTLETVNVATTSSRWAPLVGVACRVRLFDRADQVVVGGKFRTFDTVVPFDPSLYGTTDPGEARTIEFDLPVGTPVAWATVPAP